MHQKSTFYEMYVSASVHAKKPMKCINASKKPEVYFGMTRQHAEVAHKTLIIFTYKNHLDIFCINRKQFI
jgi:hypothetical protein